ILASRIPQGLGACRGMNRDVSRRRFLAAGALGLAANGIELGAEPLHLPIGCQTYPVRDALGKDFPGTLRELAGIGYRMIEMCSPPGYEKSGYGPLIGRKAAEMVRTIRDAGFGWESSHFQFPELKGNLADRTPSAKE